MPELVSVQGIESVKPEQALFRYMSLAKAMDLIKRRRLFFACIENLRSDDRNEGTVHAAVVNRVAALFDGGGEITAMVAAKAPYPLWF